MSGLFSPKMPAVPEPVKPPTTDDARQAEEDLTKLRRRRGRAATFLMSQGDRTRGAAASLLGAAGGDAAPSPSDGGLKTGGAGSRQAMAR